jgi:hypothetical protein
MDRPENRLALIEWIGRDQRVLRSVDVHQWPVTLGRGLQNTVVLDDPQVAEQHALVQPDEQGHLNLLVQATRNGVWVAQRHLPSGACVPLNVSGVELHLGGTQLRLRWPSEALAPEELMPQAWRWPRFGLWPVLGLALLWLLLLATQFWISLDPGAGVSEWLPFALGAPLGLLLWCALWALGSKVFRHQFDFMGHLCVAAPSLLLIALVNALIPQVAAALGWAWVAELGVWAESGLTLALLWAHVRLVLPAARIRPLRVLNAATLVLALLGSVVYLTVQHRSTERWRTQLYLSTLPLPAWRLDGAVPVDRLLEHAQSLRAPLEARVREAAGEEDAGDDEAEAD